MTAQTVLPDAVGVLPHSRDNAATIARPDMSRPVAGDGSRWAGALLPSDTAIVAVAPSLPILIIGAFAVFAGAVPTKTLTTTNATGISAVCDQAVSHSRISRRDSRRLARFAASCASARRTVRRASRPSAVIAPFSVGYTGMKWVTPLRAIVSRAAR